MFRDHCLVKNDDDNVSLVTNTCVGECYLTYDDDALASSFEDDDVGTGYFYCHRSKLTFKCFKSTELNSKLFQIKNGTMCCIDCLEHHTKEEVE